MKWTEYGKDLLMKRSVEERFYMLDDIVLSHMLKERRPMRRGELCDYLADFTEIDRKEVRDNIDAVLEFLIRNRQIERTVTGAYAVRPDAPQSLSPLHDNIGAHPDLKGKEQPEKTGSQRKKDETEPEKTEAEPEKAESSE